MLNLIADFLTRFTEALDDIQAASAEPKENTQQQMSMSLTLKFKIFESVLLTASQLAANDAAEDAPAAAPEMSDDEGAGALPTMVAETLEAAAATSRPAVDALA